MAREPIDSLGLSKPGIRLNAEPLEHRCARLRIGRRLGRFRGRQWPASALRRSAGGAPVVRRVSQGIDLRFTSGQGGSESGGLRRGHGLTQSGAVRLLLPDTSPRCSKFHNRGKMQTRSPFHQRSLLWGWAACQRTLSAICASIRRLISCPVCWGTRSTVLATMMQASVLTGVGGRL
jgi:hypothetical protein